MIEVHELDESQASTLLSTFRRDLLQFIIDYGPVASSDIVTRLGCHEKSVYYHIRRLEAVGLIRPEGQRPGVTRAETLYVAVAKEFRWKGKGSPERRAIAQKKLRSILRKREKEAAAAPEDLEVILRTNDIRLSPEGQTELRRRMNDLVDWAIASSTPAGATCSLTVLIIPKA